MSHDWPVAMSHDWPVAPLTDSLGSVQFWSVISVPDGNRSHECRTRCGTNAFQRAPALAAGAHLVGAR
jgi:hypothetical protein